MVRGFPGGKVVKVPSANAGDARDMGSISGLGRSPGVGNSNPLQYSCLENPMDRGTWRATAQCSGKESDTTERDSTWALTPAVRTLSSSHRQRSRVQSPVREPRFHKPQGMAKKIKY